MDDDEVQEELCMHLAKTILVQSVNAKDIILRSVIGICTVSIPSYFALLKLMSDDLASTPFWIKMVPLFLWVLSLISASAILFPRVAAVDFKNPQQLIARHSSNTKFIRKMGLFLFSIAVSGVVVMCIILISH